MLSDAINLSNPDAKPFRERFVVNLPGKSQDDDDGEAFYTDEEPIMLGPELGFGYCPLSIGQIIDERNCKLGKLEIVRKLGWATYSTVWLARICK